LAEILKEQIAFQVFQLFLVIEYRFESRSGSILLDFYDGYEKGIHHRVSAVLPDGAANKSNQM